MRDEDPVKISNTEAELPQLCVNVRRGETAIDEDGRPGIPDERCVASAGTAEDACGELILQVCAALFLLCCQMDCADNVKQEVGDSNDDRGKSGAGHALP